MLQKSTHGKGNPLGERNNVWWYCDSSAVTNQERVLFTIFKSTHFQPKPAKPSNIMEAQIQNKLDTTTTLGQRR